MKLYIKNILKRKIVLHITENMKLLYKSNYALLTVNEGHPLQYDFTIRLFKNVSLFILTSKSEK